MAAGDLCGGQRWGAVPADVPRDRRLSQRARWLFTIFCTHANRENLCRLRLEAIARTEQASIRTVQTALRDLEKAGRVIRHAVPGKADVYQVVRDPALVVAARLRNAAEILDRSARYTTKRNAVTRPVDKTRDSDRQAAAAGVAGGESGCTSLVQLAAPVAATVVQPVAPQEQTTTENLQQLGRGKPARPRRPRQAQQGRGSAGKAPPDPRQPALLMPITGAGKGRQQPAQTASHSALAQALVLMRETIDQMLSLHQAGQLTEQGVQEIMTDLARSSKPERRRVDG